MQSPREVHLWRCDIAYLAREIALATQARGWNISRQSVRQDNATLPCAHQGLKDANVDPFFIQQQRRKNNFLNGEREQCISRRQCECVNSGEAGGRAAG